MREKEIPFETQFGTVDNEEDIEQWVLTEENYKFDYCLIAYSPFIYTPFISEILSRFYYHRQGIISYSNIYDELPTWWIEALIIIQDEIPIAEKAYSEYIKQKVGNK